MSKYVSPARDNIARMMASNALKGLREMSFKGVKESFYLFKGIQNLEHKTVDICQLNRK